MLNRVKLSNFFLIFKNSHRNFLTLYNIGYSTKLYLNFGVKYFFVMSECRAARAKRGVGPVFSIKLKKIIIIIIHYKN